jgi:glycosyltransferase involved in cell wall biosynthesis
MIIMLLLSWLLLVPTLFGLGFWLIVGFRVHRMMLAQPTIRRGLSLPPPEVDSALPSVSIVIPTHNEERVADRCARSLRELRHDALEIIFVLDRCTDSTADILRRHAAEDDRIILIENETCPDDWAGKCHAASLGAERASGAYLLFTDADTVFDPDLVRAATAVATDRGLGLLSVLSTLSSNHAYELIAQPVASINLIRMYPIERVNRDAGARPFANGQFMLFERSWYERIGGHHAVKDDLLEDIAFARRLNEAGGRGGVFLADGMLRCSMYDSLTAFRAGWKRIFIEACNRKPGRLRENAWRVLLGAVGLPVVQAVALVIGLVMALAFAHPLGFALGGAVLAGFVAQLATLVRIYRVCGAPLAATLFFPAGSWIVSRILFAAARDLRARRPIVWGGREYVLEPR